MQKNVINKWNELYPGNLKTNEMTKRFLMRIFAAAVAAVVSLRVAWLSSQRILSHKAMW